MSKVLEKLQEQVEKVQLLGLEKPEMFEAVRNPSLLRDAFQKIDQHHLGDCSDMRPVAQVSKHVRDLYSLLVAERDALLNEESNQAEPKVEMQEDGNGWRLHISSLKWDGAITSILETIESMGLTLVQANISCDKMFVLDAFLEEEAEEVEVDATGLNEENQP